MSFKKVVEMFSSVCEPEVYTMSCHLQHPMVDVVKRFGTIAVLDASFYELFNLHIKNAYRGFVRVQGRCMQKTFSLLKRQQKTLAIYKFY